MTRIGVVRLVLLAVALVIAVWVARNTYWTEISVPTPLKGEALTNPFYAQQKLAQALGAQAEWSRGLSLPPTNGVVVAAAWNWDLTPERRSTVEHWVETGGRLVVDQSLIDHNNTFGKWSGLGRSSQARSVRNGRLTEPFRCYTLDEQAPSTERYSICGMDAHSSLTSARATDWSLSRYDAGKQVVRVGVGRGTVTLINGKPFVERGLFDDDNARLFVAATQLRSGDRIHFFTENHYPSLLELTWRHGWPVVCVLVVLIILALWRNGVRFGPAAAATEAARRSLAEQIRGTGQFTLRTGGSEVLQGATARALHEVARIHISAYDRLPGTERMGALARMTGFESDALAAALHPGSRRPDHLRQTLQLLESARRRILLKNTRLKNGNRI
jgi:hypothetical protein